MKRLIVLICCGFILAGCNFGGEKNPYDESPDFYQPLNGLKTVAKDEDKVNYTIDISKSMNRIQQTVASHQAKPRNLKNR